MANYKVGIVLGGGGARGFAHLGILQALREQGIQPDVISGVSVGALVGAFIAAGQTPMEAFEIMKQHRFLDFAKIELPVHGLLSLEKMGASLREHLPYQRLEDLPTPLIIAVSNLFTGKVEYIESGDLIRSVQASASIPVLFSPVQLGEHLYADGALFDNLPISPLEGHCQEIISCSISPIMEVSELGNLLQVATRTFQLSVSSGLEEVQEKSTLFIEPKAIRAYDLLDTSKADELYQLGYVTAKNLPKKVREKLIGN